MQYILDEKTYVDNHKFKQLAKVCQTCIGQDVNGWLEFKDKTIDLTDTEEHKDIDWFVLFLYDEHNDDPIPNFVLEKFAPVRDMLKNMAGVYRALFNFVGPNSTIPDHVDSDELPPYAETNIYNIVLGVFVDEDADIGLEVENEFAKTLVGKATIFDGQIPHRGWNRSNEWRCTLFMFVDKEAFNEVR
jgi:hypothetical protein|tara:strand:+ start:1737 stop:2300 length:564 start_codon:yes stop_codon:yes gene_type:complete